MAKSVPRSTRVVVVVFSILLFFCFGATDPRIDACFVISRTLSRPPIVPTWRRRLYSRTTVSLGETEWKRRHLTVRQSPPPKPKTISARAKRRYRALLRTVTVALSLILISSSALANPASATTEMAVVATESFGTQLRARHLLSAASIVAAIGGIGLGYFWQLPHLATALLQSCVRCTVQLNIMGGLFLTNLMVVANARPWMLFAWVVFAGYLAAREASNRIEYTYPSMQAHLALALCSSGVTILGLTTLFKILGNVRPWYSPRTWIPVTGMLFGNSLTAVALAVGTLTKEVATNTKSIELRLARGATWKEAMALPLEAAFTNALTPIINSLAVTGTVQIPGMMTGQILAGQTPYQAALYQILILLLIASTAAMAVQLLVRLATNCLIDRANDRLDTSMIFHKDTVDNDSSKNSTDNSTADVNNSQPNDSASLMASLRSVLASPLQGVRQLMCIRAPSLSEGADRVASSSGVAYDATAKVRAVKLLSTAASALALSSGSGPVVPILQIQDLFVTRPGVTLSLDLYAGDRVAIVGSSGLGKSQILRTIGGLEVTDRARMWLSVGKHKAGDGNDGISHNNTVAAQFSMAEWRRRVAIVPQENPTIAGTPREFYDEVRRYHSHQNNNKVEGNPDSVCKDPVAIGEEWDLPVRVWDNPWSTLSGGEGQRAALAISLALQPDVLLLDESTSGLDETNMRRIEDTLSRPGTPPIIMVSHSQQQVDRFCTRVIDLGAALAAAG